MTTTPAPMPETRDVHDPFLNKTVKVSDRLTDRLRGRYAQGPTMPNGEPEFGWREFDTPPIQKEAADEIDRLSATGAGMPTPTLKLHDQYPTDPDADHRYSIQDDGADGTVMLLFNTTNGGFTANEVLKALALLTARSGG